MADESKTPEVVSEKKDAPDMTALQAEIERLKGENEKLKGAQSNASSEAAKFKKMLHERMSEQEKAAAEAKDLMDALKAENERLKKEQTIASHTAGYLGLGFGDDLARVAAEATYNNDFGKLQETIRAFITAHDKAIAADNLRKTPHPGTGGVESGITKEQFEKMGYLQRAKLFEENPDLYKKLNE